MSFPWAKEYTPSHPFMKWMDEKLPLPRLVYNSVGMGYPVPRNLNYFWNFGVLALVCLTLQIVTGIVMAMHYAANAAVAFDTIEMTMRDVNWGWLMRYAHANGASAFFVVIYIHIFRGFYYGSYKAPREMVWLLGVPRFGAGVPGPDIVRFEDQSGKPGDGQREMDIPPQSADAADAKGTIPIAADAADAADEAPRALMIAAPRCCTTGMNVSAYHC